MTSHEVARAIVEKIAKDLGARSKLGSFAWSEAFVREGLVNEWVALVVPEVENLHAEAIRRAEAAEAELQAYIRNEREGHADPCTYGSLCPYCEIANERAKREAAEKERDELRAEVEEQKRSFGLRWDADMRAIKRWQEAGNDPLVWPDHADLCVWLLGEVERLKFQIECDKRDPAHANCRNEVAQLEASRDAEARGYEIIKTESERLAQRVRDLETQEWQEWVDTIRRREDRTTQRHEAAHSAPAPPTQPPRVCKELVERTISCESYTEVCRNPLPCSLHPDPAPPDPTNGER